MTIADIVAITTAVSALISAIAAAIWGHGLMNVKDEVIKVKESQIESLRSVHELNLKVKDTEINTFRELTPMKIREYFVSVTSQMEEQIDFLKNELDNASKRIQDKNNEIQQLRSSSDKTEAELIKLMEEYQLYDLKWKTLYQVEDDLQNINDFVNTIEESRKGLRLLNQIINQEIKQGIETIICPVCHSEVGAGYKFCDHCGGLLKELTKN